MHAYVCRYVYVYVYMYFVYLYVYLHIYIYMYTFIYIYIYRYLTPVADCFGFRKFTTRLAAIKVNTPQ